MERLIQEDYLGKHWEMVVICILLNQTTNQQVRRVLDPLFDFIKNPEVCSSIDPSLISPIVMSTGFGNVKAKRIVDMSKKWITGFTNPSELPGVGKYALESWEIFVNGNKDISPSDKKLKAYLERS